LRPLGGLIYESRPPTRALVLAQLARSGRTITSRGDLHFVPGDRVPSYWHSNLWLEPYEIETRSVSLTASALRSLGALWTARPQDQFRRHELVAALVAGVEAKPRAFPFAVPRGRLGAWALTEPGRGWASATTESPFPGAEPRLKEDHEGPPSTAYLKLQEALLLAGRWPQPGDLCLDAGASPGGWTWVLSGLGARVISVDKAPLDQRLHEAPGLEFRLGSAFALKPADLGPLDWFFCDVICYPKRLWSWLEPWLAAGTVRRFVVTVKMQGQVPDWETLDRFAAVPGARLVHLHHNKHELTWLLGL